MKIPDEILAILSKCEVEGNILFLPQEQLDRKTYLAVNKCLSNIGGKWNRKAKGHVFDHDPSDDLDSMLLTGETVDMKKVPNVNPVDIRREYLALQWTTDFVIHTADGQIAVREFADPKDFSKKAVVEKLELSRRYWAILDISDWKLVVSGEANTNEGRCVS